MLICLSIADFGLPSKYTKVWALRIQQVTTCVSERNSVLAFQDEQSSCLCSGVRQEASNLPIGWRAKWGVLCVVVVVTQVTRCRCQWWLSVKEILHRLFFLQSKYEPVSIYAIRLERQVTGLLYQPLRHNAQVGIWTKDNSSWNLLDRQLSVVHEHQIFRIGITEAACLSRKSIYPETSCLFCVSSLKKTTMATLWCMASSSLWASSCATSHDVRTAFNFTITIWKYVWADNTISAKSVSCQHIASERIFYKVVNDSFTTLVWDGGRLFITWTSGEDLPGYCA